MNRFLYLVSIPLVLTCCNNQEDMGDIEKEQAAEYLNSHSISTEHLDGTAFKLHKEANSLDYAGYDIEEWFEVDNLYNLRFIARLDDCNYLDVSQGRTLFVPSNLEFKINFSDISQIESKTYDYYDPFNETTRTMFQIFLHFDQIDIINFKTLQLSSCSSSISDLTTTSIASEMKPIYFFTFKAEEKDAFIEQIEILRR